MIAACIFDFDGVVVDTADYHYLSWKRLAAQLGFEFTEKQNEAMKGISRMDSLDVVLEIGDIKVSHKEKLKMAHVKNEWYKEYLQSVDSSVILPGVVNFLEELTAEGIPYALGSASRNAKFVMSKIGIESGFAAVFDGNDTVKSKPDPEVFLKAAAALNQEPKDVLVFEDSYKGIVAAKDGGFLACGVGEKDILHNADFTIQTFENFNLNELRFMLAQVQ